MAAEQLTIALDANGADAGPAEVVRGAALAAAGGAIRVLVFGPVAEIGRLDAGHGRTSGGAASLAAGGAASPAPGGAASLAPGGAASLAPGGAASLAAGGAASLAAGAAAAPAPGAAAAPAPGAAASPAPGAAASPAPGAAAAPGPGAAASPAPGVEVVDAPVSIAKAEDPARAVRSTPESSIVQAVRAVADGRADALVSGGSTGAALAAGLFHVKRARGVHRPALAVLVPVPGRPFLLLDCGANVEVRPEHLVQFAHMGAAFMEAVIGLERPRVALLSNGTEASKGTEDVQAAHAALAGAPGLAFAGNVEGFAVGTAEVDVIVTDGFTGNVFLKVMEGTADALLRAVREAATSSARAKAGGLLLRPALGGLRAAIDPEAQGGAFLLGLRQLGVVPHGSFGASGIARAIELAARGVRADVVGRTHERLAAAGALRRPSEAAATVPDP